MKRAFFGLLASGGAAVILLTSFGTPAAHALTISPARLELEGKPGVTVDAEFTVINEEAQTRTFYLSTENFEAQGETGSPQFTPGTEGLAGWIQVPSQVTLASREARTIPVKVNIPATADPGGNFAAVFLGSNPPATTNTPASQVSVGSKLGVLVLLRVLGPVKEGGGLLEFGTQTNAHIFAALPIDLYYRFQNSGADRVEPTGTIAIKNTLRMTSALLSANPTEGNVLPASIRRFTITWGDPAAAAAGEATTTPSGFFGAAGYEWHHFALGWYTAQLALAYGTNGTANASANFVVIPWQLLLIVLVILIIIILIVRTFFRWHNRRIIERARSHS